MYWINSFVKVLFLVAMSLGMTACMVGPNFRSPHAPHVKSYTPNPLPKKTVSAIGPGGKAQVYVKNADIPGQWWELFHSPEINILVQRGIANSPTLKAAYAALRVAQETLNAQIGNLLVPAVNGQFGGVRQLFSGQTVGANSSSFLTIYNATVNVSYTLDVFGGARRQIEGYAAQVDNQAFLLLATYLTLTSNIVSTAIAAASYKEQVKATKELIVEQRNQLKILQKQYELGGIAQETVLNQKVLLEQTRALLPPLEQNLAVSKHALDVLVGDFPDQPIPDLHLNKLNLPRKIPVSLPSNLVRQRPDVRASEALLHYASAQIGVATANMLPQFVINGAYGWQSSTISNLFATTTNVWSIGAQITQPLFHGGALLAQRRAAIAAYEQACAQYKQTVLQAFQNVADSLRALENDAKTLEAQKLAEIAAKKNLDLVQTQYWLGGTSYLNLLIAQQQYRTMVVSSIRAQAARYTDTVALFQALGGGWWNKEWCQKECRYVRY